MITNLVVIQPIDLCNLNCSYCYLPGRKNKQVMSNEVLEALLKCIFNSSMVKPIYAGETLKLLWHSGEPLLAGIDFYENALRLLQLHNKKKISVSMEFQSNATPINQKWCDFIKKNNITIAVSLDGPEALHDKYRKNWHGRGSHHLAMKGINCLKKNKIPLRGICVLTKDSIEYPNEIYNFFIENEFESICFNVEEKECFNTTSSMNVNNESKSFSIIEKYKLFMSTFYDRWNKDGKLIHVREFGSIIGAIKFQKEYGTRHYLPSAETLAFNILTCSKDGDISTFSPELSGGTAINPTQFIIGNVLEINTLDDLLTNNNFQDQLLLINKGVEKCSKECTYFSICGGGSASNKFYENGTFDSTETSVCILSKKTMTDLLVEKLSS